MTWCSASCSKWPPARDWLSDVIELEVPEDVVLPYEITKPGYVPRTLYVPAGLVNRRLTIAAP